MKIVIIEDEFFSAEKLSHQLQKIDASIEILAVLPSVESCLQWFRNNPEPDLIFSDIQLEDKESFELFRQLPIEAPIIYTTAFNQYAIQAFKQNSVDYLLKPISFERFLKTINKIVDGRMLPHPSKEPGKLTGDHFFVKSNSKFFRINFSAINYIEGMKDYLKIHTGENTLITHQTMMDIEKLLPTGQFIRVHKSYIVAISHIRAIYGNSIEVNSITIPIGISYKDKVMELVSGT